MGMEIERKYLVDHAAWKKLKKPKGDRLKQGYILNDEKRSVRVRISETKAYLTLKASGETAMSHPEYEYKVPFKDGKKLLETYAETGTEKTRYEIKYKGKLWEVDVFQGDNKGLIVAEIELKSEGEEFEKPEWVSKEVTEDERYANSNLSVHPFKEWKKTMQDEKSTVLFIQGGGEGAYATDKKLVAYLKDHLGKSCTVRYPKMPKEDNPDYEIFKTKIDQELKKVSGPVILAGHSLGGCFLVKYMAEQELRKKITGLFLVATPFWGKGGWNYEGFTIDNELASKRSAGIPTFFYHSTKDEIVPVSHLDLYKEKFPHATFLKVCRKGHQLKNNLAEVVQDIYNLIA